MAEEAAPSETVMVVVRMRPFNTKEKNEKRGPCIELDYKRKTVSITLMTDGKAAGPPNCFTYDSVHGEDTVQKDFYNTACRGLVNACLSGYNGKPAIGASTASWRSFQLIADTYHTFPTNLRTSLRRHHLCVRPDRLRQDVDHAGRADGAGAARRHP